MAIFRYLGDQVLARIIIPFEIAFQAIMMVLPVPEQDSVI